MVGSALYPRSEKTDDIRAEMSSPVPRAESLASVRRADDSLEVSLPSDEPRSGSTGLEVGLVETGLELAGAAEEGRAADGAEAGAAAGAAASGAKESTGPW